MRSSRSASCGVNARSGSRAGAARRPWASTDAVAPGVTAAAPATPASFSRSRLVKAASAMAAILLRGRLALVEGDQLALRDDVPLHRLHELRLGESGGEPAHVERV